MQTLNWDTANLSQAVHKYLNYDNLFPARINFNYCGL